MYSLNYKVTTSACDSEGRLKLYSALQMMQDCSEMWIDSEPVKVLRADIDYNKHLNNAHSASRRVTLARQELCPLGDGTVAGGLRCKRFEGRVPSGCQTR